jgi:hypothetical protein
MHIGAALLVEPLPGGGTPAIGEVREHLEQRLACCRATGRSSARLAPGAFLASWERDQRFEIEAHVRHATLPSPGDEREFLDWISVFYSHPLDRSRPLWETVLLDGLADSRWALVSKTHHCLVDGVGSVDVVDLLLDAEPASPRRVSAPPRAHVGLGRGRARMAPPPTGTCRPGGRGGPRRRSRRRTRADASA